METVYSGLLADISLTVGRGYGIIEVSRAGDEDLSEPTITSRARLAYRYLGDLESH